MVKSEQDQQIGYILRSYPRLSQTFVLNEILALERLGVSIEVFAMTDPHEKVVQSQVAQVKAPVNYLDTAAAGLRPGMAILREHLAVAGRHPRGYWQALFYVAANRSLDSGYTASSRWECFLQAVHLAHLLDLREAAGRKITHLHAHFAHDPALVAHLVHRVTGIHYSFTAHARDLFQVPLPVLQERIRQATAVVTCCQANLDYLNHISPAQRLKFSMVYHGVNLQDFQPPLPAGGNLLPACPLILSVGRLVEKKGYQDLLQALLIVKRRGEPFRCVIYGDGPLCQPLGEWIAEHGLAEEVWLNGDCTQQELISIYQNATIFILTPVLTDDGDRDGIPNVLLEAMAVGLPVITTAVSGIPELVQNRQNGLLYQPHDVEGISSGIVELLCNAEERQQLGGAASKKVYEQFDIAQAANRLKELFTSTYPSLPPLAVREGRLGGREGGLY